MGNQRLLAKCLTKEAVRSRQELNDLFINVTSSSLHHCLHVEHTCEPVSGTSDPNCSSNRSLVRCLHDKN